MRVGFPASTIPWVPRIELRISLVSVAFLPAKPSHWPKIPINYTALAGLNPLYRPGCPQTHRGLLASALQSTGFTGVDPHPTPAYVLLLTHSFHPSYTSSTVLTNAARLWFFGNSWLVIADFLERHLCLAISALH